MFTCVHMYTCVSVHACGGRGWPWESHMWRPEAGPGSLPRLPFLLFVDSGVSVESRACRYGWASCRGALCLPSKHWAYSLATPPSSKFVDLNFSSHTYAVLFPLSRLLSLPFYSFLCFTSHVDVLHACLCTMLCSTHKG